jgi:pimeloyl-ACP methyl ester carboxylesterase
VPGRQLVTGRAYVQLGLDALDVDLDAFLLRARQRILLLRGESDGHVSGTQIDALAAAHRHVAAAHIAGAGHNIGYEAPLETARVIATFVGTA